MRIIKEGKNVVSSMRVICKKCEAELEIEARDFKRKSDDDGVMTPILYAYKCPCCFSTNYLSYNELTEDILFDYLKL